MIILSTKNFKNIRIKNPSERKIARENRNCINKLNNLCFFFRYIYTRRGIVLCRVEESSTVA